MAEKLPGWADEVPRVVEHSVSIPSNAFTLYVHGKPHGKGRPRFGKGRAFPDKEDLVAENEIRRVWEAAGRPILEGAIELEVTLYVRRAQNHFTSRGMLSSTGKRFPFPSNKKPDVDNALKTIMDALNTRAWHDDVQITIATVRREWSDQEYTRIIAMPLREMDVLFRPTAA